LEHDHVFSAFQSGFHIGRSTDDPIARLISAVHLGFQAKQHTVAVFLDLQSAFNRVEHTQLLRIFEDLVIPPMYGCFYKAFLNNRIFRVRVGDTMSSWVKESCGSPQGTISSPLLFIIYAESLLQCITPVMKANDIEPAMYCDDFSLWKMGFDVPHISSILTNLINTAILPWCHEYNMRMSPGKCYSFLFSLGHNVSAPEICLGDDLLVIGTKQCDHIYPWIRILGLYLDHRLTMSYHMSKLTAKVTICLCQLAQISNSLFGLNQSDLRSMYLAYIRSALEYCASTWYACLSKTNREALQCLQNKALCIALGVP
jgi:hypothetical protein